MRKSDIIMFVSVLNQTINHHNWEVAMFKEIGTYIRIVDSLLAILLVLDRGVKSILVLAVATFIISAAVQFMITFKHMRLIHYTNVS